MRTVYQNSYCTTAAISGENSLAGCFGERVHPCQLPSKIGFTAHESKVSASEHAAPFHDRAWVLQERLLSPRTLLWGSREISWECFTCQANEQHSESTSMEMTSNNKPKLKEVFRQLCRPYSASVAGETEKNRFSKGWHEIVKTYCPLALTFPADKLIAFAGIAEEIQRHSGLTYYYGLWASSFQPGLFLSELLWPTPVALNRCRSYSHNGIIRAPTFSWVSFDGPVDYRLTFHDRIFNVSSGMRCLSKYKEADNTIIYSEKGRVMGEISSFRFDP